MEDEVIPTIGLWEWWKLVLVGRDTHGVHIANDQRVSYSALADNLFKGFFLRTCTFDMFPDPAQWREIA